MAISGSTDAAIDGLGTLALCDVLNAGETRSIAYLAAPVRIPAGIEPVIGEL
jgi:hypothetical protein